MVYLKEIEVRGKVGGDGGEIVGRYRPEAYGVGIGTVSSNSCNISIICPIQTSPLCRPEVVLRVSDLARDEVLSLV